jgi:hypothetical protein
MNIGGLRVSVGFKVAVAWCIGTAGCASATVIQSQPTGAKVYLDGQVGGNTPYTMSDTKMVGSSTQIRLEYPGYQSFNTVISRNEEFDPLACIGGVFALVPFLWVMKYKPVHTYELTPLAGGPPAAAPGGWNQPPPAAAPPPPAPPPAQAPR